MSLPMLIIGALFGVIIAQITIFVGTILYDKLTLEKSGCHMIQSSEVAKVKEELMKRHLK